MIIVIRNGFLKDLSVNDVDQYRAHKNGAKLKGFPCKELKKNMENK